MQHLDYQNISNSCNSFKKKPQQYLRFRWASPFVRPARGLPWTCREPIFLTVYLHSLTHNRASSHNITFSVEGEPHRWRNGQRTRLECCKPRSDQTKDYKMCICCFSAKHAAVRRKSKDWLTRNQNNVSEWSDMSTCGLLFQ